MGGVLHVASKLVAIVGIGRTTLSLKFPQSIESYCGSRSRTGTLGLCSISDSRSIIVLCIQRLAIDRQKCMCGVYCPVDSKAGSLHALVHPLDIEYSTRPYRVSVHAHVRLDIHLSLGMDLAETFVTRKHTFVTWRSSFPWNETPHFPCQCQLWRRKDVRMYM